MELLAQLVDTKTHQNTLEKEVAHLHTEYNKTKQEKENLEYKIQKLEVYCYLVTIVNIDFFKEWAVLESRTCSNTSSSASTSKIIFIQSEASIQEENQKIHLYAWKYECHHKTR